MRSEAPDPSRFPSRVSDLSTKLPRFHLHCPADIVTHKPPQINASDKIRPTTDRSDPAGRRLCAFWPEEEPQHERPHRLCNTLRSSTILRGAAADHRFDHHPT